MQSAELAQTSNEVAMITMPVRAVHGAASRLCAPLKQRGSVATFATRSSTAPKNWLEENCGDVPVHPRPQDLELSGMMRGGHALQVASKRLLEAKLASAARGPATSFSDKHTRTLEELKRVEEEAVERVVEAVQNRGHRFRPSATIPLVECTSFALGTALSLFGEDVSRSYLVGVKSAIADYYNDQIREIYAEKPDEAEIKELFKIARDEELKYVDEHTPETGDAAAEDLDPIRNFASASTKALFQISTRL